MTFLESVRTCFTKYAEFKGRASRSEYWWFILFYIIVAVILNLINHSGVLSGIFGLIMILPSLAVQVRRLHDTDRSGWFILLNLVPIVGWIVLLVWYIQKGTDGSNRFDVVEASAS